MQNTVLLSPSFLIFVLLIVLNFVLIFSGKPALQAVSCLFTASLLIASFGAVLSFASARIVGGIVLMLALVMALLLYQQVGGA